VHEVATIHQLADTTPASLGYFESLMSMSRGGGQARQ
jgi:hypothetical protein